MLSGNQTIPGWRLYIPINPNVVNDGELDADNFERAEKALKDAAAQMPFKFKLDKTKPGMEITIDLSDLPNQKKYQDSPEEYKNLFLYIWHMLEKYKVKGLNYTEPKCRFYRMIVETPMSVPFYFTSTLYDIKGQIDANHPLQDLRITHLDLLKLQLSHNNKPDESDRKSLEAWDKQEKVLAINHVKKLCRMILENPSQSPWVITKLKTEIRNSLNEFCPFGNQYNIYEETVYDFNDKSCDIQYNAWDSLYQRLIEIMVQPGCYNPVLRQHFISRDPRERHIDIRNEHATCLKYVRKFLEYQEDNSSRLAALLASDRYTTGRGILELGHTILTDEERQRDLRKSLYLKQKSEPNSLNARENELVAEFASYHTDELLAGIMILAISREQQDTTLTERQFCDEFGCSQFYPYDYDSLMDEFNPENKPIDKEILLAVGHAALKYRLPYETEYFKCCGFYNTGLELNQENLNFKSYRQVFDEEANANIQKEEDRLSWRRIGRTALVILSSLLLFIPTYFVYQWKLKRDQADKDQLDTFRNTEKGPGQKNNIVNVRLTKDEFSIYKANKLLRQAYKSRNEYHQFRISDKPRKRINDRPENDYVDIYMDINQKNRFDFFQDLAKGKAVDRADLMKNLPAASVRSLRNR